MNLKPWYQIVTPREDLREGKPLDASEFAVHLDQVRDGRAPAVYQNPAEFFERTYFTRNLAALAKEVVRRLNGVKVETSAVFNLSTQFGGGKTHSLTLIYHLARGGDQAIGWKGVPQLLELAGVSGVPEAAAAVFVGTEFDSLAGRGGDDGTPRRMTPWGEIAWQLLGEDGWSVMGEHDQAMTAPGGDVIHKMLPVDRPAVILLDELMNYMNRTRKSGLAGQLYSFLQNLSEAARSRDNVVLAVSIPASELEMSAEDQSDYERLKKLLDRLGKAVILSAEEETSEIIRRRLFEWHGLPPEARKVVTAYADWMVERKNQLPGWFPVDNAREALVATYPFHPSAISVFERKWRGLPRFQQTRGVLRLLALWVSRAYSEGYRGAHRDPLISLGTAPLDDTTFRTAAFEQLGETRLEAAVTTDIVGKNYSHASRLDFEAAPEIKKARLHRKVATAIFFESNGGQQKGEATLPEVRLAVVEPDLDVGNAEQCLEALVTSCYYLTAEKNRYRFSFQPNLNKLHADRRATVTEQAIREKIRTEIEKVFAPGKKLEKIFFPENSGQIPDRPILTLVITDPELDANDPGTLRLIESMTLDHGASKRCSKTGLLWSVGENAGAIIKEARDLLAWEDISNDVSDLRLDESRKLQLDENLKKSKYNLRETVWRTYKNIFILSSSTGAGELRRIDLGLIHSSAADSMVGLILGRLQQEDIVVETVSPSFLVRNWPPALPEWSTKAVRDTFYASPLFPRLLNTEAVKKTIAGGVESGMLAYVSKSDDGYDPFMYMKSTKETDIEIADDVYVIRKPDAEKYLQKPRETGTTDLPKMPDEMFACDPAPPPVVSWPPNNLLDGIPPIPPDDRIASFRWKGDLPSKKWMTFYTKVLSKFIQTDDVTITLEVKVRSKDGITNQKLTEARTALRELEVEEHIDITGRK